MLTLGPNDTLAAKVDAGGTDIVYDVTGMLVSNTTGLVEGGVSGHGDVPTTAAAILSAPAASKTHVVSQVRLHNTVTTNRIVTLYIDRTATLNADLDTQMHTITLPGFHSAIMDAAGRWTTYNADGIALTAGLLDTALRVTADVVNATVSFADITGLTVAIKASKVYLVELYLFYITNATTTGAQFGFNGPAGSSLLAFGQDSASTPGIASTNIAAGVISAYETNIVTSTTGPAAVRAIAQIQGIIENGTTAGTLAARCRSEVAVAAGLTVQRGSWMKVREIA